MYKSVSRNSALSVVVLGLAMAVGASAQTTGSSTATKSSTSTMKTAKNPDSDFAKKASMDGMVEVQLGNLAQQQGASDSVKQFGTKMAQDHAKANDELKQIASGKGIDLPASLDKKHQSEVHHFTKLSGAKFDKAYMDHMVGDHKKDIADFKKEASSGKDADLRAYAQKTLPTLEEHLQLAQQTNDAVKKAARK
jgi:putative membrane protein